MIIFFDFRLPHAERGHAPERGPPAGATKAACNQLKSTRDYSENMADSNGGVRRPGALRAPLAGDASHRSGAIANAMTVPLCHSCMVCISCSPH